MSKCHREQLRAARTLLNWSQVELARACKVDATLVVQFEAGRVALLPDAQAAIRSVLESAGVEFVEGEKPGVRPKTPTIDTESFWLK